MMGRDEFAVDGRPVYVWRGGAGISLLLLHGGWGGAQMHWAPVWDALAREFRVMAPEFPGLAYESSWAPRSLEESADWVEKLLDATDTDATWIAGNSFGAAVAWHVASRSPERCLGLILVDGGPPPKAPAAVRALIRRWPLRPVMVSMLRRSAYAASTLEKAFADPQRAPAELREVLTQQRPRQLRIISEIVLAGDGPSDSPRLRTLVVWGAEDRLPGSTEKMRRRLVRSLPHARMVILSDAGHLPQLEQPEQLAHAVVEFVRE
jgi:2-hydroxy-6-oxonona-2,4-dienedioate hydrolase